MYSQSLNALSVCVFFCIYHICDIRVCLINVIIAPSTNGGAGADLHSKEVHIVANLVIHFCRTNIIILQDFNIFCRIYNVVTKL